MVSCAFEVRFGGDYVSGMEGPVGTATRARISLRLCCDASPLAPGRRRLQLGVQQLRQRELAAEEGVHFVQGLIR